MRDFWLGISRGVSSLVMLLYLAACSSGGDDDSSCSPAPQITGVPPTVATVGERYVYDFTASFACTFFICHDADEVQMPPGATMDHFNDLIEWIPTADFANQDVAFVIATPPDSCFLSGGGNRAFQSWTVRVLPDATPPTVTSATPANGSVLVPVNSIIRASFSEQIDPQTVTAASFLVSGPSGPISGNLQVESSFASFTPSPNLPSSSTIAVTVTTAVTDVGGNGLASNYSWTFSTGVAPDTSPPTPPSGLSATSVRGSEVDFSWTASVDDRAVAGYRIYRDGAFIQSNMSPVLLSASDTGLNFNTVYCYTVAAFDSSGNESAPSDPLCVTTLDFLPGNVATWGIASRTNGTTWARTIPDIVPEIDGGRAIARGLVVKSDGTVWQWGAVPTQVPNVNDATAVAAGGGHSLVIRANGTVWAWGNNSFGQLGDGTTTSATTPVQMLDLSAVVAVEAGQSHTLALKSDGTVWAAGANFWGQLGDGTTTLRTAAVQVQNLSNVIAVAAGRNQSLALKSDGTVWIWGGSNFSSSLSTPTQVPGISNATAIAQGDDFSLAVRADGTVWAWGTNGSGQLGDGTTTNRAAPVQVTGLTNIVAVAGGSNHSMALRADGTVWAWGYNGLGQLGDGTQINKTIPVQVLKVGQARAIAAGSDSSLALR